MSPDDFPDDLADRIRRDAASKSLSPAGVIGRFDELDPSDLKDVQAFLAGEEFNQQDASAPRDMLVNDAEPITEANRNDPDDDDGNLSDTKSRDTNTADGDAVDNTGVERGESDRRDKSSNPRTYNTTDKPELTESADSEAVEAGIPDTNPGSEAVETDREEAVRTLRDVLRFYNDRLDDTIDDHTDEGDHPDRPTTAREYFRGRGWDDDTIDDLLLGWAPARHTDQLVAYLHERGHSRETILATGAVGETDSGGFYTTFSGRYILPYFDADADPAYAIARCTGAKGGGGAGYDGHPGDHQAGKYAKLRHTDDRVPFDEPIYGLDTLEEGEPVVVAEGIADAITARALGYSTLSPVAKEFKKQHYAPLLDAFDRFDVPYVTVVPDSERAAFHQTDAEDPESILEAVSIPATSPGMGGALRTADHLREEGVDVRVADLPLPASTEDFHKVDLDDYIHGWADDLDAVIASAKPPEASLEYENAVRTRSDTDTDEDDEREPREHVGESVTGLWDLDLGDLENLSEGDRTKNPFSHTGDSESYFVVRQPSADLIATDYKASGGKATYNALTALLVDAGKRSRDNPEGPLDDVEVFYAWRQAKKRRDLGDADPVPYRALVGIAVEDGLVDEDDLVKRDSDTGDVVDKHSDTDTYTALPPRTYGDVLKHVREEYGVDPGREPAEYEADDSDTDEEHRTDPRHLDATVDVRRAWDAAGRVTPDELEEPLPFDVTDDGEAWLAQGERVDVVRAVGLAEGLVNAPGEPFDDYPTAYNTAREAYGAPLPRYYTTTDAIAEFDAVLDVIDEVTFWDLDPDALNSEITEEGDEVVGAAARSLNPAWRESKSGNSVKVYPSGNVWDADTELSLPALRFVALDAGLLERPTDSWGDGEFTEAYRLTRETYGAPLPRWEPADDGDRDHTGQLPEPDELVETRPFDGVNTDALGEARVDVEALLRKAMTEPDTPTVVRALPATGKTTGTIKTAAGATEDDLPAIPATYLAPRKELQKQALEKADRWGADAKVLPVFSDEQVNTEVLEAAVSHVREAGKNRLRDRWAILSTAAEAVGEDAQDLDIFVEPDDEEADVDLDRPTCETADGDHGDAWALAVHVARRLGYTPREIHTQARGLFGAPLPCMTDDHGIDVSHLEDEGCRYSLGWSDVADPDAPTDLLVGSYVHAHVESARTYYERANNGEIQKRPRAVVLDEFVGEAFTREFGGEALDFATWLASSLRGDVDDRRDMYEADLGGDAWVEAWLEGNGDEHDTVAELSDALARYGDLFDAHDAAEEVLKEVDVGLLESFHLRQPLSQLADGDDARVVFRSLSAATDDLDLERPGVSVARWVEDDVVDPLKRATKEGTAAPSLSDVDRDAVPIGGDLDRLVDRAVEAVEDGTDGAPEAVHAATTALRGGRDGCRRLAAWADDGYAHPDAHHLLRGVITPTDADSNDPGARRIDTDAWAFDPDATEGTVLDVVDTGARSRTLVDRNGHGAILHTPPAREAGNGDTAPLVGLDATGRRMLWATALLEDVTVDDIHDTHQERAQFLEEALDLRVIQASDRPRPYEGDPTTKDTDGDVALLEALAEEYAGIDAPRSREDRPTTIGKPAVVTTKGVREVLEDDDRLDDVVAAWEHFGNHTGSNDLGGHRLAALLGSQHYGDHAVERFAALAGESVDTSRDAGRGADLTYGNDVGDEYLAHMRDDQTMQAILRFARGDSGATVVARTSALRDDLPVVGRAQVVETWSDTAAAVARAYRRLGDRFTVADVADDVDVDVSKRQVRRVLAELADAGYVRRLEAGEGTATVFEPAGTPGAGETVLPDRADAVDAAAGHAAHTEYYTWNVRVRPPDRYGSGVNSEGPAVARGAPPSPPATDGVEPPG